jgi:hypothetical protein
MKKLIIGALLASLVITQPVANAGDKEWAVAGKILTGLFVLDKIVSPPPPQVVYTQPTVVYTQPTTVTSTTVVQPTTVTSTTVVQPTTVTTTTQHAIVQPQIIVQQPTVVYHQPMMPYYSQYAPTCSTSRSTSLVFNFGSRSSRASYHRECAPMRRHQR